MRYYECRVNTTVENIEKNAKVRLRDYDYESTVGAVNKYFYRNIISNVQFFVCHVEGKYFNGIISFNEEKISCDDAIAAVENSFVDMVSGKLSITDIEEITTCQYIDCLLDAKRRCYVFASNYINEANQFLYDYITGSDSYRYSFSLDEKIVSLRDRSFDNMYDSSMKDEIDNIRNHVNDSGFEGNMVHYVISSKSMDATLDMVDCLLGDLYKANRINSRRIEVIHEIDPKMYRKNGYFENIISNNCGGAVVIDMTEKFGEDPVSYTCNCQFIEKMVRKYKNDCLFIFAYNTENPGFSYTLLPMVNKHLAMVKIKEATGSKEDAILYLEDLIKASNYNQYAHQASEYMESYKSKKYTQSDVIEAYEKFEPWCVNHNFFNAYNYDPDEDIMLDRNMDEGSYTDKLEGLIGLQSVKEQINKILVNNIIDKERKSRMDDAYVKSSMHMIFGGNPGSAKTTVAKLFAGIAKEKGILKSGAFVDRAGTDYCRMDGIFCLLRDFEAAKGGVLFIDEAYAIKSDDIITTLIKEMENKRDDVIVVLAGYNERMQGFLNLNEGLKSRIPNWVNFPDYSTDELVEILKFMTSERGFVLSDEALKRASVIFDKARLMDNFGNGRYARNLLEKAIGNQSVRLMNEYESPDNIPEDVLFELTVSDFDEADKSDETGREAKEKGEALCELNDMIGICSAKSIIRKAVASFKMKKRFVDMGLRKEMPSMHMVFTGNPGTAKTTTARLLAEILRDEKVLPSGKFVEVGRADLIGQHVGETAPLVKKRFSEAQGGVLFIDEAYSLSDGSSYSDEAISTIVQEMENHREDVIVIFAGYPNEMNDFLERNPGMNSRIAFRVEFDDYSTDELCEIADLMMRKKGMHLTDEAMDKVREACDIARRDEDYGNGRYVRKLLEEAEMNLAERLMDLEDELDIDRMTTIDALDIKAPKSERSRSNTIGFMAN